MAITDSQRKEAEELIYKVMDLADTSGTNLEYYKELFANMSNRQFEKMFKDNKFPLRFQEVPYVVEPTFSDMEKAFKAMDVPIMEEVRLPHVYKNSNGVAVKSKEALVGYIHLRKEQQIITKKNSMSTDIVQRDMKTGRLINFDKNGNTSDKENESLIVNNLKHTAKEMNGPRADRMTEKSNMYAAISSGGIVSEEDIGDEVGDSLALNLVNTYLLGAHINSNIINTDYYLPHTLKNKGRIIDRA